MRRLVLAFTVALALAVVGAHAQDYYKSGGAGAATNPASFTGDVRIAPDVAGGNINGNITFLGGSSGVATEYGEGIFWGDGTAGQYAKYIGIYPSYTLGTFNFRGYQNSLMQFGFGTAGETFLRTPLVLDDTARTIVVAAPIAYGVNVAFSPAAATIASGFGTGSTPVGNANGGRILVGTTPGVGGTINFNTTFTTAPACWVQNETTGTNGIAAPTTTTLVVSGLTLVAAQTVVWGCNGGF